MPAHCCPAFHCVHHCLHRLLILGPTPWQGAEALGRLLASEACALRTLAFGHQRLGDEGAPGLLALLGGEH